MAKIQVLDCTLRDGGYCNQWNFGMENIRKITGGLAESGIDIIECGFLTQKYQYDKEKSRFNTIEQISEIIPENRNGKSFVCMMNYGEYDINDLPNFSGNSIDGIRVAFHKKNLSDALEICKQIKKKGYNVYIQAMLSMNYTDEEFLELISRCNKFNPYAFYIVDSFGVMKRKDLIRLFYMVEHNLNNCINIGYHSHNNMQLAYSNAQALVDIRTSRNLIIDSSIFGMGRGAGNLNTELFVEYLNDNIETEYKLKPLFAIIDEILNPFYQTNYWGYSLPNYLSAKHNAHPNYAEYLDSKKTLTVEDMDEIFSMMDKEKRSNYDKNYIENLYIKYMETGKATETHFNEFKSLIEGKEILIIAPGRSSAEEKEKIINSYKSGNIIAISVNFDYPEFNTDYIFVSNLRRFREINSEKHKKCIITSNIPADDVFMKVQYHDLLNNIEAVQDNSAMMLIKFMIKSGVKNILVAGLDGYSFDSTRNFADRKMNFFVKENEFKSMNAGMSKALKLFSSEINIKFVTEPKYIDL